ncbi:T9SS type A sorting domain-containing protein [Pontibacter anaerobius]|uniref:T9SS type A sorting domain-containing protein n=1 Tax=Pontibacter anaerobius TaxID=2993940 RepID=A0ABT3RJF5_9BACT|nr:T9SS type A sorting domain-containing protein [Pontibacter anaerobius]MCX2741956.1 T9SS type A sorting domain-containing protein [Pontibacter anaerobius]
MAKHLLVLLLFLLSTSAKSIAVTPAGDNNKADTFQNGADSGESLALAYGDEWGNNLFTAKSRFAARYATPTITMGALPASYSTCSGATLDIPFTTTGTFQAGNTFRVLLSDKNSSFLASTTIGEGMASPIRVTIPGGIEAGAGYKLQVIATSPYTADEANAKSIQIITVPDQPAPIAGPTEVCLHSEAAFSVAQVAGAEGYTWTVPDSWSIITGQGTHRITVRAGTKPGTVSVVAYNQCGVSAAQTVSIKSITVPDQPAVINATKTEVCSGSEVGYSVAQVTGATGYTWTVPNGWMITSGQGTSSITVIVGSQSGNISVSAHNQCGVSAAQMMNVEIDTPVAPAVVAVRNCEDGSVTLQASGAWAESAYYWYTSATGKEYVATGSSYKTDPLTATTTYYASLETRGGCEGPRTAITVQAYPVPTVTAGPDETVCADAAALQLTGFSPEDYGSWSGAGVSTEGIFNPQLVGPGVYELTYTYSYPSECAYTATKNITVTTCTGLPESRLAAELILYPNPTRAETQVVLPLLKATGLTLRLLDAKGQQLHEQVYPNVHGEFKQVMDLRNKPKGIYLLQLILDDGVITKRLMKE